MILNSNEYFGKNEYISVEKNDILLCYNSSTILKFMLSDILDFSQIIKGSFQLNKDIFNLKNAVYDVVSLFEGEILKKKISISIDIEKSNMENIFNDVIRFKQVNKFKKII